MKELKLINRISFFGIVIAVLVFANIGFYNGYQIKAKKIIPNPIWLFDKPTSFLYHENIDIKNMILYDFNRIINLSKQQEL